jgi:hypothetical protein
MDQSSNENLVKQVPPRVALVGKSEEELLAMIGQPSDWRPEIRDAAKAELRHRGVDTSTVTNCPFCHAGEVVSAAQTGTGGFAALRE